MHGFTRSGMGVEGSDQIGNFTMSDCGVKKEEQCILQETVYFTAAEACEQVAFKQNVYIAYRSTCLKFPWDPMTPPQICQSSHHKSPTNPLLGFQLASSSCLSYPSSPHPLHLHPSSLVSSSSFLFSRHPPLEV